MSSVVVVAAVAADVVAAALVEAAVGGVTEHRALYWTVTEVVGVEDCHQTHTAQLLPSPH